MPHTIDIHAHMLPEETIRRLGKESPRVAPKLIAAGRRLRRSWRSPARWCSARCRAECWDLDLRLADMDRHGVDMQAVCATVHTFFYDAEPALGLACAALQNDEIAAVVGAPPRPLRGARHLADAGPAARRRRAQARDAHARPARRPDRLQRQRQQPRRSLARAGLGGGERARGVHPGSSARRDPAGRPAQVLLHAQLRRPAVRDHDCRRGARVRRRDRALSRYRFLPVPRRRLPALSGRPFRACLQCAGRAEVAFARIARGIAWRGSTTIRSCIPRARSNS